MFFKNSLNSEIVNVELDYSIIAKIMAKFQLWLCSQRSENSNQKPEFTAAEKEYFKTNAGAIRVLYTFAHPFTFYGLLDLKKKSDYSDCKKRTDEIRALLINDPDKINSDDTLKAFLPLLKQALKTLSSPEEKRHYDRQIKEYETLDFQQTILVGDQPYIVKKDAEHYDYINRMGKKWYLIYADDGRITGLQPENPIHETNLYNQFDYK